MSLLNLLLMRPRGVVSKKFMGAKRMLSSNSRKRVRPAVHAQSRITNSRMSIMDAMTTLRRMKIPRKNVVE